MVAVGEKMFAFPSNIWFSWAQTAVKCPHIFRMATMLQKHCLKGFQPAVSHTLTPHWTLVLTRPSVLSIHMDRKCPFGLNVRFYALPRELTLRPAHPHTPLQHCCGGNLSEQNVFRAEPDQLDSLLFCFVNFSKRNDKIPFVPWLHRDTKPYALHWQIVRQLGVSCHCLKLCFLMY